MFDKAREHYQSVLDEIREAGLWKEERVIKSVQSDTIEVNKKMVINFCANNYLGLSSHPDLIRAAGTALIRRGYGMSSVRFICGTQDGHKRLEEDLSEFVGMEDTILYSSCFDANGGLFETLLGPEDAIISDELNHASIIDGIRLCKAERHRYRNNNMADLEEKLKASSGARIRLIATDGVFSMDGTVAHLDKICDLADKYEAMVMVDDSHATGFVGKTGRGTHEYRDCMGRVDIITSTLGKALGGASGGFTSARKEIVDLLRNRSRPYLFSNSLAPAIVSGSLEALDLLTKSTELRDQLETNVKRFRAGMKEAGFDIAEGDHAIVPIMLGDAHVATEMSKMLLEEGVYVVGFSYPVVPKGKARIRVQISAEHSEMELDTCIRAFQYVRKELKKLA